jgi:hypothetical protein
MAHREGPCEHFLTNRDTKLVELLIQLFKEIWGDRNLFLHGGNWKESKQHLWARVQNKVPFIYSYPPILHGKFPHRVD